MKHKKMVNVNIEMSYSTEKHLQDFMGILNVAVASRMHPNVQIKIVPGKPIDIVQDQDKAVETNIQGELFKLFESFMSGDKKDKVLKQSGKSLLIAYLTE